MDFTSVYLMENGEKLHPRTTKQRYKGRANWDLIKILKEDISIPVIGNGDVFSVDDIKKMFDYTKCDAVMIARAAQGNPWIFRQAKNLDERTDILISLMKISMNMSAVSGSGTALS